MSLPAAEITVRRNARSRTAHLRAVEADPNQRGPSMHTRRRRRHRIRAESTGREHDVRGACRRRLGAFEIGVVEEVHAVDDDALLGGGLGLAASFAGRRRTRASESPHRQCSSVHSNRRARPPAAGSRGRANEGIWNGIRSHRDRRSSRSRSTSRRVGWTRSLAPGWP